MMGKGCMSITSFPAGGFRESICLPEIRALRCFNRFYKTLTLTETILRDQACFHISMVSQQTGERPAACASV
jgi:hypothetical protein